MVQHLPLLWLLYTTVSTKLQDMPTLIQPSSVLVYKVNIFLRPEEAMSENC